MTMKSLLKMKSAGGKSNIYRLRGMILLGQFNYSVLLLSPSPYLKIIQGIVNAKVNFFSVKLYSIGRLFL